MHDVSEHLVNPPPEMIKLAPRPQKRFIPNKYICDLGEYQFSSSCLFEKNVNYYCYSRYCKATADEGTATRRAITIDNSFSRTPTTGLPAENNRRDEDTDMS